MIAMICRGFLVLFHVLVLLLITSFTLRYFVFPYLIRTRTRLRASAFSLTGTFRALEWRDCDLKDSVIPTFRAERGGWKWGGQKGDDVTGWVVYRIEGLCLRYREGTFKKSPKSSSASSRRFSPSTRTVRFLTWLIQILIHHYPSLARVVSVQLVDCRIILEDCDGVELVFNELAIGGRINFEREADSGPGPATPVPSPNPGSTDFMREHPLCASPIERGRATSSDVGSPTMSPARSPTLSPTRSPNLSPPMSPTTFSPMTLDGAAFPAFTPPPSANRDERSSSRLSDARRRASVIQTRMTTTAGQIWSRATGRLHGSVTFRASIQDLRLLQSQTNLDTPKTPKPSVRHSESDASIIHSEPSFHSLRSGADRPKSSPSIRSIHTLLRSTPHRLPSYESGYDTLIGLEGKTGASLGLGFGPKKGLAGEDTLNTQLELGKLRTSVAALERLAEIAKAVKGKKAAARIVPEQPSPKFKTNRWSTRAWPRIVLRALESVEVKIQHLALSHQLAAPNDTNSRNSSTTAISDLSASSDDKYTLSIELSHFGSIISAADSSNNDRARNAFGTNASSECKVRGVGFEVEWESIQLHCIAPGEKHDEKSQLLAIRQAEFSGFSSWRPSGWSREELLFSNDPNLALIVARGNIASVDCAFDVQLLHELQAAVRHNHPTKPEKEVSDKTRQKASVVLPPRLRMVLDVGPIMGVIADRLSEDTTTLSLSSDGAHLGCFTTFSDLVGRRKDRATSKKAFAEEEELRQRREEETKVDYTLPPDMLPTRVRRKHNYPPAAIPDDLSISMKGDAQLSVEPITVKIALSGDKLFDLADIGKIHGTITGDVLGWHETFNTRCTRFETSQLDWTSLSCGIDFGIQEGIHIDLWEKAVIDALVTMGQARQTAPVREKRPSTGTRALDRLPSGVSARFSFGAINVFLGHTDINPHIDMKLIRGVWLQTSAVFEYALYKHRAQAFAWRHYLTAPVRAKLSLPEDITTQALAFATRYRADGGTAALISFNAEDLIIQPVFNGERFVRNGGIRQKLVIKSVPQARTGDDFVGWGFQRLRAKRSIENGEFANNVPPLEVSDTDQAQRPWLRVKRSRVNLAIQQTAAEAETEFKVNSKLNHVSYVSDLSHVYSNLHAGLTVKRVMDAWKRPKSGAASNSSINLSLDITIPNLTGHFAFPLKEQLYLYASGVGITKLPNKGPAFNGEQVLLFVPSPRQIGNWEEIGRIKRFAVSMSDPASPLRVSTHFNAIRIRVPHMYQMNSLILNINVTIKSLKLLFKNFFRKQDFSTTLRPAPEEPKRIPHISISIDYVSLEAKDDPVETSLNLIWRAGLVEQEKRNAWEDTMAKKLMLLGDPNVSSEESLHAAEGKKVPRLTKKATVDLERARWALDTVISDSWVRRMRAAKQEQRRREHNTLRPMQGCGPNIKLPITLSPSSQTAPLFRAAFHKVNFSVSDPGMSRQEIIQYMGKMSCPFDDDVDFSLMVPLKVEWTMSEAKCTLRDYPLPLIRIQRVEKSDNPSFQLSATMIIAEELSQEDSIVYVPVEIIPANCGKSDSPALLVNIAKTIMPVKMYGEPQFNILSKKTTEFTWGNSYQPSISDFTRVIETLSHPPRDPSPKVGFWDKLRLICHIKPTVQFAGPCHLHMKGSRDPYDVVGLGAGFALAWRGNTKLLINQPNPDHEAIQIVADQLLVAIPDLTSLNDDAASGGTAHDDMYIEGDEEYDESDSWLIRRRYTKPCARFVGGTRVGFGFVYERTCRPWNCRRDCGDTDNLLHRQCHEFGFIQHQKVKLRSPEAIKREEHRLGHPVDSYEGFRSDYIHFSVSLVAPTQAQSATRPESEDPSHVNSLHAAPKASHHFLQWWKLFDHKTSLPIRQGKLFPDSPPPSKKFSKSLGTIKYRFDLRPLYVSHIYPQVSKELWSQGKSESLGIKARFGRFRFDAHQRLQERKIRHPKLRGKEVIAPHKPFYAVDVLADDLRIKGIRAHFAERIRMDDDDALDPLPRASELPNELKVWFNYLDYIDADRRPFDQDPKIELVDFGDCPHVYYSKRVKARASTARDNDSTPPESPSDTRSPEVESSKFGHEKTHHCYLGVADGVSEVQKRITQERIDALQARLDSYPRDDPKENLNDIRITQARINTLTRHLQDLDKDHRHMSANTLDPSDRPGMPSGELPSERAFQDTIHVHCPRLYLNNQSRNIVYTYIYSMRDRKKEEYFVSHASLRSLRDSIQTRMRRRRPEAADDGKSRANDSVAQDMCAELVRALTEKASSDLFRLVNVDDTRDVGMYATPHLGLPPQCAVKPKMQILVFKPQIALRSDAADNAIVLLSVQEASLKRFTVEDVQALDSVTADVLSRNYASLKDVQAFYPTAEALTRERSGHGSRGLDFIPLEIFLDERSQATDYDRILLKSVISASLDKFNHIRLPQGLEWPENALDEYGEPIKHLKIHQDLTTIVTPQLTLSATSKHYDALYTVITDLLMYQDPEHKHRSEAVDDFSRQFDSADRDVGRLIIDVHTLQQTMRTLLSLQQGYETNFERLEEAGKDELFKIRADLQEGYESLYTINALIAATLAKDDARAAMKTASRMNIRIRGIAWHLQEETLEKFAKVEIESVLLSLTSNKNGSTDSAMVLGNLLATNPRPTALYHEIVSRDDYQNVMVKRRPFASLFWSSYPAIGGISIFPKVDIEFVNVRFRIEERIGHQVVDYIFSDRIQRRKNKAETSNGNAGAVSNGTNGSSTPMAGHQSTSSNGPGGMSMSSTPASSYRNGFTPSAMASSEDLVHKSGSRAELYPLQRSKSQVSISHPDSDNRILRNNEDTIEMRLRASKNKMFGQVRIHELGLNLSYKSDDSRKHGTFSMPDCVDFRFKTPNMAYYNKVWPIEEIFEHVKRDIKASAWTQSGDLLSQLFKKTSLFRSKKQLSDLMSQGMKSEMKKSASSGHHSSIPLSPLRNIATHASSKDASSSDADLAKVFTKSTQDSPTSGGSASSPTTTLISHSQAMSIGAGDDSSTPGTSPPSNSHSHGFGLGHGHGHGHGLGNHSLTSIFTGGGSGNTNAAAEDDSDDEDRPGGANGSGSGNKRMKVKGLLGKLTGRHKHDSPGKTNGSTDELSRSKSRGGSIERVP
ncbi:hypothetical protein I317_02225 [Kwoniella heveanensis CBS 569]|nr:hypothetical protein I317_02225 [Kwoniella heveanensis CBS 569]